MPLVIDCQLLSSKFQFSFNLKLLGGCYYPPVRNENVKRIEPQDDSAYYGREAGARV